MIAKGWGNNKLDYNYQWLPCCCFCGGTGGDIYSATKQQQKNNENEGKIRRIINKLFKLREC